MSLTLLDVLLAELCCQFLDMWRSYSKRCSLAMSTGAMDRLPCEQEKVSDACQTRP
ncbi:hypothetical protein KC19_2G059300 [Ceratodon purpureus]|uniref:Uncharacterized protein n=1 Tax=Ceratodon purpureus TaxID=3225 RepID=A0A8T0IQL9_CERPU|nr:hypothetical protein KC19_2G059300 [Ceratodon purpureus]